MSIRVSSVTRVSLIYGLWILPAIIGAVLDWHWWVTFAVIAVGAVIGLVTDGPRIYRSVKRLEPDAPLASRVPFIYTIALLMCTVPLLVDVGGIPERFAGLLVAFDLVIMDLRHVRFRNTNARGNHSSGRRA